MAKSLQQNSLQVAISRLPWVGNGQRPFNCTAGVIEGLAEGKRLALVFDPGKHRGDSGRQYTDRAGKSRSLNSNTVCQSFGMQFEYDGQIYSFRGRIGRMVNGQQPQDDDGSEGW